MKKTTAVSLILLAALAALVFGWFALKGLDQSDKVGKVRVGYLPIAAELPLFVAVKQGFFEAQGIKIELTRFTSSNELANAATADHVDIMAGTASNVIFDVGAVSGKKHQLFAVNPYSDASGHVTDYLLVRRDSGIHDLPGLKGKRIASFPGSVNKIFVNLVLEKHGVKRDSYEYIEMAPPNWEPALASGAVDAVSALEPVATQIIKDDVGISIFAGFYADLMKDVPLSGHWVAADFRGRGKPELVRKFVAAYRNALAFIRDHPSAARQYLTVYANVRADIVNDVGLNPWKMVDDLSVSHLQDYANLLFDNGALREKPDVKEYLLPSDWR